jgi:hypothetical protein
MAGKIFVSYRQGTGTGLTDRLYQRLGETFEPGQLVFDVRNIMPELNNIDVLLNQVSECDVFLATIGKGWSRGLDDPRDYVRLEIEAALQQGKRIIPVLMGEAQMPRPASLPKTIQPLAIQQALRVRGERFASDVQELAKAIRQLPNGQVATSEGTDETPNPQIPAQGYGPHFEIGDDGIINFAPPSALDQQGNNIDRLNKMHPGLRDLSKILVQALSKGNVPHIHLLERSKAYYELISQKLESIDFPLLYMAGVRLANAEKAATDDNELPSLAASVRETIDSLLQLHGTFILASRAGLEAIEAEQRYQRTRQEEAEYRSAAVDFAQSLQHQPMVVDPKVASAVLSAAEEIGKGANPERSSTVATGILKNVTVTFVTAAALGTISAGAIATGSAVLVTVAGAASLVAAEGLKKSKPFAALAALVTQGIERTAQAELANALENLRKRFKPQLQFFLSAEQHFKALAGRREEFKWLTKTVRWVGQQARAEQRGRNHQDDQKPELPDAKHTSSHRVSSLGNIYLAKVVRVDPSTQTAFINYDGDDRPGLLTFNRIHPDYYQISIDDRQRLLDRMAVVELDRYVPIQEKTGVERDEAIETAGQSDRVGRVDDPDLRYRIEQVIKRRQIMLVQVTGEDPTTKGAITLTTYLSVAGRYVVLMPNNPNGGAVNFMISDSRERSRRKELIENLDVPEGMGLMLRVAGLSQTKTLIERDFQDLMKKWETVRDFTLKSQAPTLVYEVPRQSGGAADWEETIRSLPRKHR